MQSKRPAIKPIPAKIEMESQRADFLRERFLISLSEFARGYWLPAE